VIVNILSRRVRTTGALLCSTAIAAALALTSQVTSQALAAEPAPSPAAVQSKNKSAKARPDARWTVPTLSPDVMRYLMDAQWNGPHGLVAGVIDKVRDAPASRDAVLNYARGLAPGMTRDLTTAADLAVLTANDKLALAPNAASALRTYRAGAAPANTFNIGNALSSTAASFNDTPRALPPGAPSAADQTWHLTMIGAQIANLRGYTGNGVAVAVADTGFDINNDALKNKLDLTRAQNYVINSAGTAYDPKYVNIQASTDTHGSHVAGIIGAELIGGIDMRGVAYDATIVPIRLLLGGKDDAPNAVYAPVFNETNNPFVLSLDYFTSLSNVRIYNASYGPDATGGEKTWTFSKSDNAEAQAAGRAVAAGKIIVAAAGNDRSTAPIAGQNPSGLALMPFVQPGNANAGVYNDNGANLNYSYLQNQTGTIVAVMSVGTDKKPAYYSQFCGVTASWCVAAPGGDVSANLGVYSTIPDNTYGAMQGTSMAAPAVSGALAVLVSAFPTYNAKDLTRLMYSTSEDLGAPGLDAVFGYGLIRLDRATAPVTAPAAGATVTVVANNTTYWGPPVTTAGGFTKDGGGILTISGITNTPGTISVTEGTFAVDGTLNVTGTGNQVSIANGGVLAGFGQINGNTTIAGTLSPGKMPNVLDSASSSFTINSPGTLTFNGSVNLLANATTAIAVDGNLITPGGPGTFSKIVVTGIGNVFTANGTLVPVIRGIAGGTNSYVPGLGTALRFVEAQNGASTAGKFSSLVQPTVGLAAGTRFDVDYSTAWIDLTVTPASLAKEAGPGTDQKAVGSLLDSIRPAAGVQTVGSTERFFDALYQLNSDAAYDTAFRQLAGPQQVASPATAMMALTGFNTSISDRQSTVQTAAAEVQSDLAQTAALAYDRATTAVEARQAAGGAFASVDRNHGVVSADQWSVWGRAFGGWSSIDSQNGILGAKTRSGGLSVGADRLLAPDLVGGIAAGFVRATSDNADANARFDSFTGALYASWTPGRFVVDMRTALSTTTMTTSRTLILVPGTINGSTTGLGAGADVEVGYRVPLGALSAKPFAGLSTQVFRRRGYAESQQPFGLIFPDQTFTKVMTTLGVANSILVRGYGWNFLPELRLAWGHDLRDSTLTTQAALLDTPFTVTNIDPGKDAALVGLQLTAWTRESFRLFTSYNGDYRARARSHQVSLGARMTW
jgi:subtilase-type serine protease